MFVTSSLDKVLGQSRIEPSLDARTVPGTRDSAKAPELPATSEALGIPSESGDERRADSGDERRADSENQPLVEPENEPPAPGPPPIAALGSRTAAARLPTGLLFYLAFVGVVAATTIGVFFGIGFFLLTQPSKAVTGVTAGSDRDRRDTQANAQPSDNSPRPQSGNMSAEPAAAPVLVDTQGSRSAAAAVLPAAPSRQPATAREPAPAQDTKAPPGSAPVSRDGAASGTSATPVAPGAEAPALASAPNQAPNIAPPAPAEAAAVGHTRSGARKGKREPHARAARHGKHHRHRQPAVPQVAPAKPVAPSITPPRAGQPDPFAQRSPNR